MTYFRHTWTMPTRFPRKFVRYYQGRSRKWARRRNKAFWRDGTWSVAAEMARKFARGGIVKMKPVLVGDESLGKFSSSGHVTAEECRIRSLTPGTTPSFVTVRFREDQ